MGLVRLLTAASVPVALAASLLAAPNPEPVQAPVAAEEVGFPKPFDWGWITELRPDRAGKNVRVNEGARTGEPAACHVQSETSIASGRGAIYVGFNDSRGCFGYAASGALGGSLSGFARSMNGGRSFEDFGPLEPNGDVTQLLGDPVLAFDDRRGRLFYASLGGTVGGGSTIAVGVSTDRGETFRWHSITGPGVPGDVVTGVFADKEWIAVDDSGGAHDGNVYVGFMDPGDGIFFSRSTNGGRTWSPLKNITDTDSSGFRVAVAPGGDLIIVWERRDLGKIYSAVSSNAGRTFSKPLLAATVDETGHSANCGGILENVVDGDLRTNEYPSIAIDVEGSSRRGARNFNPFRGTTYMVYGSHGQGQDEADVFFTRLAPGASGWSKPVRLNRDRTKNDQFMPEVVTTGYGKVTIMWTDRRDDPENLAMHQYVTISRNGGRTFGAQRALTDVAFLPPVTNPNSSVINAPCYAGDYNALSTRGKRVYAAWGDNRDAFLVQEGASIEQIPDPNIYFDKIGS